MKILVFDTETTGLPIGRNPPIISTQSWPYVIQLSYIIYENSTNEIVKMEDNIVKLPGSVIISTESEKIHKISREMTIEYGVPIQSLLNTFNEDLQNCDLVVGHNVRFDKNMIMVECVRNKILHNFVRNGIIKDEYCTMINTINFCAIKAKSFKPPFQYYNRYPKLIELYEKLFNSIPNGLHNSMNDVLVCLRCFGKVTQDKDYCNESPELKQLFEEKHI